jgi:hypothetical protein
MNMLEREMASAIFVLPSLLPGTVEDYRVPHNAFEQLNEPEKTKTKIYSLQRVYTNLHVFFQTVSQGTKSTSFLILISLYLFFSLSSQNTLLHCL